MTEQDRQDLMKVYTGVALHALISRVPATTPNRMIAEDAANIAGFAVRALEKLENIDG